MTMATIDSNDIGIIGMEAYFPRYFVEQKELELHDNVSVGKYTIGLGQERMAICSPAEDAISICLNAFSQLLNRFNLTVNQIGRIEVGSESNPDRAKAIKSHLISLLGKLPISGGDHVQACYGGTAALLNASAWLESSQWETGKYAIVIAGDVAVYDAGPARATGGAGSVAILLARGCNAPIKLEKKFGHFASHVYDFYKPNPMTEYPIVDGPLSVSVYLQSALNAYSDWLKKESLDEEEEILSKSISDRFDQLIFHSPYSKIVYKAFCQLQLFDPTLPLKVKNLNEISKEEKVKIDDLFNEKVVKNLFLLKNLGNSYCASIFFNLLWTLTRSKISDNERIGVFSYGSGSMATFFSFKFENKNVEWIKNFENEIKTRLENRIKVSPIEYEKLMESRKSMHGIIDWKAKESDFNDLLPGTFYLNEIDSEHRRFYTKKL